MKYKCGGYVSYDTRKKDQNGWPIRNTIEVEAVIDLGKNCPDDCGHGTSLVMKTLEEIVKKRFTLDRHVECTECWECSR